MAEENQTEEQETATPENAEGEATEGQVDSKKKKKKLIIIIAAAVVVLAIIGGGAVMFLGGHKKDEEAKANTNDPNLVAKTVYYDLDEFLVNLNNPGNQVSFLKTIVTLELPNQATLLEVQTKMPRVRDTFQVYLRELRNSDLQGSAGLQRLRAELLLRINEILEENKVSDILFKEIIVQ